MRIYKLNVPAGGDVLYSRAGNYFKLLKSASVVHVDFGQGGALSLLAGDAVTGRDFKDIRISNPSSTEQLVEFVLSSNGEEVQTAGNVHILGGELKVKSKGLQSYVPLDVISSGSVPANQNTVNVHTVVAVKENRAEVHLYADSANVSPFWLGGVVSKGIPLFAGQAYVLNVRGEVLAAVKAQDNANKLYVSEVLDNV